MQMERRAVACRATSFVRFRRRCSSSTSVAACSRPRSARTPEGFSRRIETLAHQLLADLRCRTPGFLCAPQNIVRERSNDLDGTKHGFRTIVDALLVEIDDAPCAGEIV